MTSYDAASQSAEDTAEALGPEFGLASPDTAGFGEATLAVQSRRAPVRPAGALVADGRPGSAVRVGVRLAGWLRDMVMPAGVVGLAGGAPGARRGARGEGFSSPARGV